MCSRSSNPELQLRSWNMLAFHFLVNGKIFERNHECVVFIEFDFKLFEEFCRTLIEDIKIATLIHLLNSSGSDKFLNRDW